MKESLHQMIKEKKQILDALESSGYLEAIELAAEAMTECLQTGNKIILAGNGGSAADAQHFAAELAGRFLMERGPLAAISLCVDPSIMTCIGNDYGYTEVFRRQLEGIGRPGDIFVAISTSGNSENLLQAAKAANEMGIGVVGLMGKDGGQLKKCCGYSLVVPSDQTPRIQEIHTFTVHMLCGMIEESLFGESEEAYGNR